jgi:hypothetical protein
MAGTVTYRGDQVYDELERDVRDAVRRSAVLLHSRSQQLTSRPAVRIRKTRTRNTVAGPKGSQYTEFVPSRPGQPPALRTGSGRSNIRMEIAGDGLSAKVGPSKSTDYMAMLQLGTKKIAPRLWLSRAMREVKAAVKALLEAALGRSSQ